MEYAVNRYGIGLGQEPYGEDIKIMSRNCMRA